MWAFVLFCLSLTVTIYFYVKRNKIYDSSENLDNDTLDQYNKLDRMFIIMLLVTFGLFGLSTYVFGWFNFLIMDSELIINSFWILTIITAALYIAKKRYVGKKEYRLLDLIFKICFVLSIIMIGISFMSLII